MRRQLILTGFVVLASTAALAGCGGGGGDSQTRVEPPKLTGEDNPAAVKVAQQYVDAYVKEDARAICALLAKSVRVQLEADASCPKTVKKSFGSAVQDKLRTDRAYVKGDQAIVTFKESPRQVTVARQGQAWKVVNGGT